MTDSFSWGNEVLSLTFTWDADSPVSLVRVVRGDLDVHFEGHLPLVEILAAGSGHWIANGRLVNTAIGRDLRYAGRRATSSSAEDRLVVTLADSSRGIGADVTYVLARGVPMVRTWATVTNIGGGGSVCLESVTSFASTLGAPAGRRTDVGAWTLLEGRSDWLGEGRWSATPARALLPRLHQQLASVMPRGAHAVVSTGTWSTGAHLPLAFLQSTSLGFTWAVQVEHNGAWRWEIGEDAGDAYVAASGPTSVDHSWRKVLAPGRRFSTVPASWAIATSFDEAVRVLTAYRRATRTRHEDNAAPKVVFNDYMNTINGDPTTERLLPLIAGAAEVGAQVFCIDCGWYDDTGDWWPSVGEWLPSRTRFPGGIGQVIDAIRRAGMVPGIWIEPEVVGVDSPVARRLPDSAFFQRAGQRIVEDRRYILDLRDPAARAHLDSVIDRLVTRLGIGYFKFDYNVSPGAGTDYAADSPGDGLLGHNRAYSAWVDAIHARFPRVILENCSSGGMREDFAQTSRFQVQSTSDQQDYRLYPPIAAAAPLAVLPEQAANWAYPQAGMTPEQIAFNLNTTFLGRFFLSGYVNRMEPDQRRLIASAIAAYKRRVQPVISRAVPFWPLGLPGWSDGAVSLGLRFDGGALVTLWVRDIGRGDEDGGGGAQAPAAAVTQVVSLRLPQFAGRRVAVEPVFPREGFAMWPASWQSADGVLDVVVPTGAYASRTFDIVPEGGGSAR